LRKANNANPFKLSTLFSLQGEYMRFLLAIVFVTMLFVAGCPGGQQQAAQGGTPSGQQAATQGSTQAGGTTGAQESTQTQEQGGQAAQTQAQEQSLFGDWDMQAMMAAGQPVHCTVTYTNAGQSSVSEVWLKGQNVRSESTTTMEGETYETTAIIKGDVVYVSGQQGMGMDEDCDWVKMDNKRLEECIPASDEPMAAEMGTYDYQDAYETAPASYECDYATFGDEKFSTSGNVCDLTEQLCTLYESMGEGGSGIPGMDPEEICGPYTGEDYAQCMQAFGLE
jgi:hypothetical protein